MINRIYYSYDVIGKTCENRPLIVQYFGNINNPNLKVFIIGGQHGDEKYAKKSIKHLIVRLSKLNNKKNMMLDNSCISILSDANPDGYAKNTRLNAEGIDLNRDHQNLSSIENKIIHSFIRRWNPNYIIDVHNYPAKRKYLSKSILLNQDVFIDIPNSPMIYNLLSHKRMQNFLQAIISEVNSYGFTCDRYFVFSSSGKARHSTHDITNALNFMSIRYNIPTFLVEGRQPHGNDDRSSRNKLVLAQYTAIYSILKCLVLLKDPKYFHKTNVPKIGDPIPIRYIYNASSTPLKIRILNLNASREEQIIIGNYRKMLTPRIKISLPFGYAIPKHNHNLLYLLRYHGFSSLPQKKESKFYEVESFNIGEIVFSKQNNRPPLKINYSIKKDYRPLNDYTIFPINQLGGLVLTLFFELDSKYNLSRYNKIGLSVFENTVYPILRVI